MHQNALQVCAINQSLTAYFVRKHMQTLALLPRLLLLTMPPLHNLPADQRGPAQPQALHALL
jgi:hypothetical protein